VNDRVFDCETIAATPVEGTSEVWVFQNLSGAWHHPIHLHLEEFHILTRNGGAPPPIERGRKDVIRLRPYETIRVLIRFRDFVGPYPLHCHNIVHEDHGMMLRWDVVRG
jgi:FtsP/CotA-like multicopper oxidase with cupredoxin domain